MIHDSHAPARAQSKRGPESTTARSAPALITIGTYTTSVVEYLPYDPESPRVANWIAKLIIQSGNLQVEHIGSTAVPGCWGKGIIDLLVVYPAGGLAEARSVLDGLGFQRQAVAEPFPESRPMRVGSVRYFGRTYRTHVHVIEAGAAEARDLVRFRDLLRRNIDLRCRYEAEKRAILARGVSNGTEYSNSKGAFIQWALAVPRLEPCLPVKTDTER